MNAAEGTPVSANFPMLQALQRQRTAEAVPTVDSTLVRLCIALREDQHHASRYDIIEPQHWNSFNRDAAALRDLIRRIAETPTTSRIGLRAKALALHALLDDGGSGLCEDAALSDLLAWSLVQDILAE